MAGQQLQLTLKLSGPAPQPTSFAIDDPARISIDLPGTSLALTSRRIDVRSGGLDTILAAQTADRSRAGAEPRQNDAVRHAGRRQQHRGHAGPEPRVSATTGAAAPASSDGAARPQPPAVRSIEGIDFRRSVDGAGRVVVRLTDPHTPINLRQVGDQVVVDFVGTDLPKRLMRRFDATDYGTAVTSFDATRSGGDARLIITAKGDYEQLAYQTNDTSTSSRSSRSASPRWPQESKRLYTGEKMTLDLPGHRRTRGAAAAGGHQRPEHRGQRLGARQRDAAPAECAVGPGAGHRACGPRVSTSARTATSSSWRRPMRSPRREKAELAARKDLQELEPLRSEFLQVNYAKAADMATLIKSTGRSLLSPRGNVSVDVRTNTLLLQDTADRLEDIRRLVTTLDIPVRQVKIESRLVIVNNDFQRELGAVLGFNGVSKNGANGLVTTSGSAAGTDTIVVSALTNLTSTGSTIPGHAFPPAPMRANRYNVNLPVSSPAGSIALGILGSDYLLDLELSAAQTETRADIISSPSVITANQKQATIMQGTEIPYQESASSGATSISFKPAVLSLQVTPQITPDNRIILDLDVKKDTVGTIVVASGGVNVPSIDTQEITTQVLVSDGQTVVLGGILQTTHRIDETKVPYLGDMPILGNLFKTTTKTNDKDELLIFVTPKILHEGVNVY